MIEGDHPQKVRSSSLKIKCAPTEKLQPLPRPRPCHLPPHTHGRQLGVHKSRDPQNQCFLFGGLGGLQKSLGHMLLLLYVITYQVIIGGRFAPPYK